MQKQLIYLAFLLIFFSTLRSQPPEAILDSVNAGRKPEKIHTQFDQGFYQPGETIWFKTYIIVDGFPGTYSTIAKAELLNEQAVVIASRIIPVTAGTALGSIQIPDSAATGSYLFRLYTQHMLAMKTTSVYYKPVLIAPSAGCYIPDFSVTKINLQFFPEGGTFLANELNNLAFIATDQHNRPVTISGVIKDNDGIEITRFASGQNGMGKVEIKPATGKTYTAVFSLPSGTSNTLSLPVASEEGTNMFVINDSLQKQLFVDSRFSSEDKQPAFIVGEMDQTIVFKTDIRKNKGHYYGTIPTKDLPGGLLHIAVFSASYQLLAERTCFVSNRMGTISAELTPTSINLSKRGQNSFTFALPDSLEGSFAVSITNAASGRMPVAEEDITMGILVTSCLKAVPNLPFYNLGSTTHVNEVIDLLLLTHDYKWNWNELKQIASMPAPAFNDFFITLRGRAYSDRNNNPVLNSELSFIIQTKDSAVNYFPVNTDDKGFFEIPGLFFTDSAILFVKNNKEKNREKKVKLELTSPPLADLYKMPAVQQELATQRPLFYQQMKLINNCNSFTAAKPIDFDTSGVVLKGVTVKTKTKNPIQLLEEKYTKGLFSSSARATIDFINENPVYTGGNIFDYLKGRYSYMQVMGAFPNYTLVFRNMRSIGTGTFITMGMYLDEMPVDASMLTSIPMKDIAMVRIYPSGIMGVGGALAVYTKQGDDRLNNNDDLSYLSKLKVGGFSSVDEFYSPDYAAGKAEVKNDNRKTLYWNPSLIYLPEDGKVPFSFFNSDKCTSYRILLQGITSNGRFVRIEKIINQ